VNDHTVVFQMVAIYSM